MSFVSFFFTFLFPLSFKEPFFKMEILELVNQDHVPTETRPFVCNVANCNKTFGKHD